MGSRRTRSRLSRWLNPGDRHADVAWASGRECRLIAACGTYSGAVIRSGLAGLFFAVLSMASLFAAMGVILFRLWPVAITLGALCVVSMTVAVLLSRRADPTALQALAARPEPKWVAACGLGLAKLSGGWEPRSKALDVRSDQEESP